MTFKKYMFTKKEFWFAEEPFEVKNADVVIFRSCKTESLESSYQKKVSNTAIIDLKVSLDNILMKMDKKSCRYEITRGLRDNIKITVSSEYDNFLMMYNSFCKKKKITPIKFSNKYLAEIKNNSILFEAFYNDKFIAGQIYLKDDKVMRWLVGASNRLETQDKDMTQAISRSYRLLIWEAIKYGKEMNLGEFDLGGVYTGNLDTEKIGIAKFKMSFGGMLTTRYHYKKYNSNILKYIRRF